MLAVDVVWLFNLRSVGFIKIAEQTVIYLSGLSLPKVYHELEKLINAYCSPKHQKIPAALIAESLSSQAIDLWSGS